MTSITDNKIRFTATAHGEDGKEHTLLKCDIPFPDKSKTLEYNDAITKGKGLINMARDSGADVTLDGNHVIIKDLTGYEPQLRAAPTVANNSSSNSITFRMSYPSGARPEDSPNQGTIDLGNGVQAKYSVKKV